MSALTAPDEKHKRTHRPLLTSNTRNPINNDLSFSEFIWIWNKFQSLGTPHLHILIADWLEKHWHSDNRHLLVLAFRDSGKSTIVGLFCTWLLLCYPSLRILVLSADFELAKKMVRNVKRIIEKHPFTSGLKPSRLEQWASDQFTVRRESELRDPSMLAKGINSNITGLRADIIICDDVEVPNTCSSQYRRNELRDRLREIDYILVPGGVQLYIGTPHTRYSIYASKNQDGSEQHALLADFHRLEVPVFDENGESQWPQRFPSSKIEAIRKHTGPQKFESQMLLRPVSFENGRLNSDLLLPYNGELDYTECNKESRLTLEGRRMISVSCWWDPSYGRENSGDANVVACIFSDEHGHYWLHRIDYIHYDPNELPYIDEATQLCKKVARFATDLYLPSVSIETNGIGRFLPGLLKREFAESGLCCAVIERTSRKAKHLRILEAFDAILAAGRLHAHSDVWKTPFIREMQEWSPGAKRFDDGLDAVAGCLASEPVRLPRAFNPRATHRSRTLNWRLIDNAHTAMTDFAP